MTRRVAVVGGGLAGITAALRCLDLGHAVVLLEGRPTLGGLTNSFRRGDLDVDTGQHVFLRCCTSYRALLSRLGVEHLVRLQDRLDVEVRMPAKRRRARLRRSRLPAPAHLAGSLLRYSPLTPADRLRAVRGALAVRRLDHGDESLDARAFGDWLVAQGQNARTVAALWDLFGIATLNAHSDEASLALAAMVFKTGLFTDASAGDIGWPLVSLQRLHGEAATRAITAAGGEVKTKARVRSLERAGDRWLVAERDGDIHEADSVVLAVAPEQAETLLPPQGLDLPSGWSTRLGSSPIVNVHVVFDRHVMTEPFIAGIDTPAQWVFDRTTQAGLASGQYIAVSVSAADDMIDLPTTEIRDRMLPALRELLPETASARVDDFFVTRERQATFRQAPGSGRWRPGPVTRLPGLFLAGAWTATGWPATMESAVRSGEAAAAALDLSAPGAEKKGILAA